jgi:acetyl-CoA carboxylase biotin carboxyl carrier protein
VDLQEIRKIVELMNEHGLSYFHLEEEGVNLKLKKGVDSDAIREAMGGLSFGPAPTQLPAQPAPATPSAAEPAAAPVEVGEEITSPMVGTYYSKPSPDSPPFVEVGSTVSEGQTLCIIEAMKVMNEIKAEKAGTIAAIFAEDSTPVQYGDALFRIQ